jgi:hypothetical protein
LAYVKPDVLKSEYSVNGHDDISMWTYATSLEFPNAPNEVLRIIAERTAGIEGANLHCAAARPSARYAGSCDRRAPAVVDAKMRPVVRSDRTICLEARAR